MNLNAGQSLLHYRLVEKIGAGGMGEVWKALDTALDREVAIKFIPAASANDAERLARFVREAKILATLNHPNIAAVYGLHQAEAPAPGAGSVHFIAMELVPGEDLSERLARGALPVDEAVDVARQVAEALEAAHEQGVIHRDLKPANIKRTPDGKIKVLDLGLAKALSPETSAEPGSASLSPTITTAGTVAGTLLGTAGYMSPEQAKGRPVDRRADIWAFGVVLHEMLTGKKLFEADTVSETLAAVLRDEVSMESLPGGIPAPVKSLMKRCLDRDPRRRLRDIGEARVALSQDSLAEVGPGVGPARPVAAGASSRGRQVLPWVLVALLGLVAAVSLWRAPGGSVDQKDLLTLVAPVPADLRLPADQMGILALSPDGKTLALVLRDEKGKMLYVRRLDSNGMTKLPGTEAAATPFFSPDGRWIGFFTDDKLKKVPVGGGAPITLCDSQGSNRGADWGTDDVIVFAPHYTQPLMRVPGAGGEPKPFTTIDKTNGERTHRWPQAVPGEDLVLYTVGTMDSPESYDDARIEAIRPSTGEHRTVLERASMARYVPSGHLVFGREGFLFAVPFDVKKLEVHGSPVPVLENVMGMRGSGVVHAGFARNGLMAYLEGAPQSRQTRLVWRSRGGVPEPIPLPPGAYFGPALSPDGSKIAVMSAGAANFDIAIYDINQTTLTRLTFEGDNTAPSWSPDGRRVSFASVRNNALMSAYMKAADGSGQDELIYSADRLANAGQVVPFGWTPDGRSMILSFTNENANNIAVLSGEGQEAKPLLETPASEQQPALSPNGRWLAYASDESGAFQVFVRAFPGDGGKWQVSTDGGFAPRWSPDGRRLFYRDQSRLLDVSVDDTTGSFKAGRPEIVFDDIAVISGFRDYDVRDANRFVLVQSAGDDSAPPGVTVVVNWLDDLKRRVPAN